MTNTRPPIISVVGHIDHGKSALQHAIRDVDNELNEAGGITQHIGAYEIHTKYEGKDRRATIIDTPGHKIFSHVREHALELSDIVLLVISSEEGWKEQTTESYEILKKLNLPFIVVFTKNDTDKSNIEKAKQTVLEKGILLEGLGGETPWVGVDSKTKKGISHLIELIFLTTDVYDVVEKDKDDSIGVLVEAKINPKVGIAGTIIIYKDVLGDDKFITVGNTYSPLRIMKNDRGETIKEAIPSMPVQIIGFNSIPPIGHEVYIYNTKKEAVEASKNYVEENNVTFKKHENAKKIISLIIRSDTASGLKSIETFLNESSINGIHFKILKKSVGNISEDDIRFAVAEKGYVIGFHTKIDKMALIISESNKGVLNLFNTIYEVIDWANSIIKNENEIYELANPTGSAKVIRIFESQPDKGKYIIGLEIIDGSFSVGQKIIKNGTNNKYKVISIEQRNQNVDSVEGNKIQFAMRIEGKENITDGDKILALPV